MGYMYLDNAGILHGVADAKTAAEFAKDGKFVPINAEIKNGYVMNGKKELTAADLDKMLPYRELLNAYARLK